MIFKIINAGQGGSFPTSKGFVLVGGGASIELKDETIARELEQNDSIRVEMVEEPEWPIITDPTVSDYSKLKIEQLRSIASRLGVNSYKMRKTDLIKVLSEKLE
jgi:hypothetical protein